MPRTIQCTNCGVALNLPSGAEGRKLKCPKCGVKFHAGGGAANGAATPPPPPSSAPNLADLDRPSTLELSKPVSSVGDLPVMPTAAGDLRETFELPMMTEAASAGGSGSKRGTSEALALFDDKPAAPRRKTGAEARAQARRCPTCGGVVAVGMSICQTCGLDLETGTRVDLDDDLSPPPSPRSQGVPIPIAIIGGLCTALSVALTVAALVQWRRGLPGAVYFVPVALFGVYASVQFLRSKSVKLLLAALTLGAVIDLVGFVALPIYDANAETTVVQTADGDDDPDSAGQAIRPVSDRLDTQRLNLGLTILFLYAVVSIYLLSPQVNRHFRR